MTLVVGLTGNIGSGKSTISKIFTTLKIPVFYADEEAKKVLFSNENKDKLINAFGDKITNKHKNIDKQKLASIVFTSETLLKKLNDIIHPEVYKRFLSWAENHKTAQYLIMEAAILFESGFDKYVDISINVHADKDIRLNRVIKRDNTDEKLVLARMNNQLSDKRKSELADYTIDNNGVKLLIPQLLEIHNVIIKRKGSR